jgi:hypothetical protein
MMVQLNIPYETLVTLVEQLPDVKQRDLMLRLQSRMEPQRLTVADKLALLESAQIHTPVNEEPSPRRADWYDDDGR